MGITKNKITEFFCIIDDFCQEYDKEFLFQHFPQLQALLLFLCQGAHARPVPQATFI